jgi:hypothetical protein
LVTHEHNLWVTLRAFNVKAIGTFRMHPVSRDETSSEHIVFDSGNSGRQAIIL